MLSEFGQYLRDSRKAAGINTQQHAVDELRKMGTTVSQALIAQYESGKVRNPDPEILCSLAQLYKKDYFEVVLRLVKEKYAVCGREHPELDNERWKLFQVSLGSFEYVGKVRDLEIHQLRAKAALMKQEILSSQGLAIWEANYPDLELVWIVASDALNDKGSRILQSVLHNMQRDVQMIYFVASRDIEPGGRFWQLQRTLSKSFSGGLGQHASKMPIAIPLGEQELGWLNTDILIANPHWQDEAVGFKYIRRGRIAPSYAMRMSSFELGEMISVLRRYAARTVPNEMERVLPDKVSAAASATVH
jgi:transcriptional regulator with XRE-family HTH domain